ncbi:hypothetical protein [Desulfotalea psychrophila]|uniref:hypothetical protein n=1 Tax=Desulfotalea psychrophila TaxID=84980 RepID=UPI0002F1EF2D|nr:hypothetical protein [Desulfotalea psychrophila]
MAICTNCPFRAQYKRRPNSLLGRLWRWHAGWCPGWNAYMKSLPQEERADLAKRYQLKRFL